MIISWAQEAGVGGANPAEGKEGLDTSESGVRVQLRLNLQEPSARDHYSHHGHGYASSLFYLLTTQTVGKIARNCIYGNKSINSFILYLSLLSYSTEMSKVQDQVGY